MPANFVEALDAEISATQAELQLNPLYQKLLDLQRVRARYPGAAGASAVAVIGVGGTGEDIALALRKAAFANPPPRVRRPSPEREAILAKAREVLRGRDHPTLTADIYDAIKDAVEIGGSNPRNNLSAMLSNSSDFKSHGRAGWSLAETNEASDDLLSRSASEASISSPALPAGEPDVRPVDPVPGGGG